MEKIFWKLYNANSELEVDQIINSEKLFSDPINWHPYGDIEGNYGTFESQQYNAVPALIEKITNSIDAILIKKAKHNNVNPESVNAPKTMGDAVEQFYNVPNGEIGELSEHDRRNLAEEIQIIATGDRQQPCITVYDFGEGQRPNNFKNTFLSLHQSNKAKIHFVQGKYNMGSTGAVVFCGEKKYQLIASKKDQKIDSSNTEFGFTLVRKHPLSEEDNQRNYKTTWYEYFCPQEKIPSFKIDEIDLGLYNRKFTTGSIVKLYSYQLPRGSKSDVTLDLWRDINQYMYHLPLPVSVYEKRDYKGKTPSKPVLGNRTRIMLDSNDKVYKKIQFSIPKESGLGDITIEVIIFNSDVDHAEFIKNKSIIYTLNGQVHGFEGQSFISKDIGFSLLKRHMLIHVDCTKIPTEIRQDLFMSNRTHLKQGPKSEKLKDEIISLLKKSTDLKKINNDRKDSLLRDSESDKDLLEKFLSNLPVDKGVINLLKKDGSLDFLKTKGQKINNKDDGKQQEEEKKLNRFPSIFKLNLKKDKMGKSYKTIPLNASGKVTIDTDVEDDYLFRPVDKGSFEIQILQKRKKSDKPVTQSSNPNDVTDILTINREGPSNGTIKLIVNPNDKAKVGDEVSVKAILSAPGHEFECIFDVKVDEKISKPDEREIKNKETFPDLPTPRKAYKNSSNATDLLWSDENLNWSGDDIVKIITGNQNQNETLIDGIIINMDSFVLVDFISKNRIKTENKIKFIKDKYFLSIYLHSLFLFSIFQKMQKDDESLKGMEIDEFISKMIQPYSSFLLYENFHIEKHAFDND